MTLEAVAKRAIDGDRNALDRLVRDLQGDVYSLALRMLWNREDAEDATQEILARVTLHLSPAALEGAIRLLESTGVHQHRGDIFGDGGW